MKVDKLYVGFNSTDGLFANATVTRGYWTREVDERMDASRIKVVAEQNGINEVEVIQNFLKEFSKKLGKMQEVNLPK